VPFFAIEVKAICAAMRETMRSYRVTPSIPSLARLHCLGRPDALARHRRTTAVFTLIHAVMLRSLPVADPDTLYRIGDGDNC
jgi:hypothetical protein